jgi:succinate dehydrogenase/fumarate reductase cytochrome b subunit
MIKSIHRVSGIAISTFFIVHIINHLFALGGADMHIAVMNLLRSIYRFPPVEVFLLLCVGLQITSGLWLLWTKGFSKDTFDILQALSGLYLSFFLIYHVRRGELKITRQPISSFLTTLCQSCVYSFILHVHIDEKLWTSLACQTAALRGRPT